MGLRGLRGICEPQVVHSAHLAFVPVDGTVCVGFSCVCVSLFVLFWGCLW